MYLFLKQCALYITVMKFCIEVIIISGFGIYGAAVVPDSGVGNTWQRLTVVLHEFLSNYTELFMSQS